MQCLATNNVIAKTDVCRQTMFSDKHFDKQKCLSLGMTAFLTYENLSQGAIRQRNNPAIQESGNCRIISGNDFGHFGHNVG